MGLSHQLISKMVYRQNGPSVALGPGHSSASKRACDHTDFLGVDSVASKGRWVNASLYINRHLFSGDPSIVSGECGYNPGFVWAPHHCTLHLPSKEELRSCLNRLNISALGVLAQDSLGREMGTNLIQLVANNSLNLDGRKLKVAQGELGGPISADFLIGDQRVIFTENFDDVDVSLIAINVVIQLGTRVDWANSTDFDSDLAKQALGWVSRCIEAAQKRHAFSHEEGQRRCFLYLNPSPNPRNGLLCLETPVANSFFGLHRHRMVLYRRVARALTTAIAKTFPYVGIIDGFQTSLGRWESSWDGIHYTHAIFPDFDGFKQMWQGGVSAMNTVMYTNAICEFRV